MNIEYLNVPIDAQAQSRLTTDGLRFDLLDKSDRSAFAAWSQAVARGFHGAEDTDEKLTQRIAYFDNRRMSGVWDDSAADARTPVATIDSWAADLTVPGRTSVAGWAISAVTVAPTHRRRGIATALIAAELRTAHALGFPVAELTVSESTIYGRFGFAPSALARDLTIDTRRSSWSGPAASGRVQFVTRDQLLVDGLELVERVRFHTPGQVQYDGVLWERQLGMLVGDDEAKSLRFVRYDDAAGVAEGFAIFRIVENEADFAESELRLLYLVAATDDAYAGLWRFLLEMDLVSQVTAYLRPIEEPLRWMIRDFRAVKTRDSDHLWTRILDVKAALEAREYSVQGRVVIDVNDPLGFATGTWALDVATAGSAVVSAVSEPADVAMSVGELGAIYLGGVSATTLGRAGRIAGDTALLDAMFRSPVQPWLSIWF